MLKPTLPKKRGYVEREIDGERVYMNIKTGKIIRPNKNERDDTTTEARVEQIEADIMYLSMMTDIDMEE